MQLVEGVVVGLSDHLANEFLAQLYVFLTLLIAARFPENQEGQEVRLDQVIDVAVTGGLLLGVTSRQESIDTEKL